MIDLIIDASIPAAVELAARNAAEAKWRREREEEEEEEEGRSDGIKGKLEEAS